MIIAEKAANLIAGTARTSRQRTAGDELPLPMTPARD
jgi:hypothetical protein